MHFIRTIQYAILAFVLVVAALILTISGALHFIFNKMLGFNPDASLGAQTASEPTYLILFAIAACLLFTLEFFRSRLDRQKSS